MKKNRATRISNCIVNASSGNQGVGVIDDTGKIWVRLNRNLKAALNRFAIQFGDRMARAVNSWLFKIRGVFRGLSDGMELSINNGTKI
ncbi:MAG: hypothetical protein IPP36_02270 [Nitrosomonadales bacterium]|nr:hypothetical protein [Nitrosomonadales bacterium]